jgi:hypothetical protein
MCVLILSKNLCGTFFIIRITERVMIKKMCVDVHVKYQLFLFDFIATWIFWTDFRKILKYKISWKSVHVEPYCSMRTDGQTDMTEIIVAFRNFPIAPKFCILLTDHLYVLNISQNKQRIFLYNTQLLVLIIEVASVCCAVGTGSLNNAVYVSPLKG